MKLKLYKVNPKYLSFLHSYDKRVSLKFNTRPFVGILTMINGIHYVLPLTSQTTEKRKLHGKNKRSDAITTFVRDSAKMEISNILHNNMIPVPIDEVTLLNIDPEINSYEMNEIRYIRKHSDEIIEKSNKVYDRRINKYNYFYIKLCCDFKKLEFAMSKYVPPTHHAKSQQR